MAFCTISIAPPRERAAPTNRRGVDEHRVRHAGRRGEVRAAQPGPSLRQREALREGARLRRHRVHHPVAVRHRVHGVEHRQAVREHRPLPGQLAAEFQHARVGRAGVRGQHHRLGGEARPHGFHAAPQEALREVRRPQERRVLGRVVAYRGRVPSRVQVFHERGQPERVPGRTDAVVDPVDAAHHLPVDLSGDRRGVGGPAAASTAATAASPWWRHTSPAAL
jgi:hypothetical protein